MKEDLDNSNIHNVFESDNIDNLFYKNFTFSNGFSDFNINNFYIKKHIKNNSMRSRNEDNLNFNGTSELKNINNNYNEIYDIKETPPIETIPIYNLKFQKSKDKIENTKIYEKNNIHTYKKNINVSMKNKNKSNKNISNSSIDEINISLKNLGNMPEIDNLKTMKSRNEKINGKITKFHKANEYSNINTVSNSKLNYKEKMKNMKINNNKNKKIFKNLMIQYESQIKYINQNCNNNKISFLKKIINKQNNNIKLLIEQNKNLVEKMKKMHEENENVLGIINSIKSEMLISNNINKINIDENYINSNANLIDKCFTETNKRNNSLKIKENNLKPKNIIYSLYDNKKLLSYDFESKEFSFIPILNQDFISSFNKEINTLFSFSTIENKIFIISGYNNDLLFVYNIKENQIKKYSNLKNNHMFGSLFLLSNKNNNLKGKLICLSGKYNKKVEIYNEFDDSWDDKIFEEMPEERGNSCYLELNNNYIYGFYGYNYVLNIYLNDIVFYDLKNNKWNKIAINLNNSNLKGIKNHFCYENSKDKIIYILGGDGNYNKIKINLQKKCLETKEDKIEKNHQKYIFNNNYTHNLEQNYLSLFDLYFNVHIINIISNESELIPFKKVDNFKSNLI